MQSVLLDPKGWQKVDGVRFVNVTPAQAAKGAHVDVRVTLASPGLTDRLCAPMRTLSQVSCWNGERSVLNFRRWALGDDSYGSDVALYRVYQVNHEVGHGLGHQHRTCPGQGQARSRDGAADPRPRRLQAVALPVRRLSQRQQPHRTRHPRGTPAGRDRPAAADGAEVQAGRLRSASRRPPAGPAVTAAATTSPDGDRWPRPARRSNALPTACRTVTVPRPASLPTWVTVPASTASTSCPADPARSMPRCPAPYGGGGPHERPHHRRLWRQRPRPPAPQSAGRRGTRPTAACQRSRDTAERTGSDQTALAVARTRARVHRAAPDRRPAGAVGAPARPQPRRRPTAGSSRAATHLATLRPRPASGTATEHGWTLWTAT